MKRLVLFMIMLAFVVAGCSSKTLPTETDTKRKVPEWYINHAETGKEGWMIGFRTSYMYAVAEDVSPSMEMALRKATLKAKAKLADKVSGELNNRTVYHYSEQGTPEQPIGNARAEDIIINLIGETVVNMYEIEERYVAYNPQLRNYRAFVLIKITEEKLNEVQAMYEQRKAQNNISFGSKSLEETTNEVLSQTRN